MRAYHCHLAIAAVLLINAAGAANAQENPAAQSPSLSAAQELIPAPHLTRPPGDRFTPPDESAISDDEFGDMVRYGKQLFTNTAQLMPEHVGNVLKCVNCHVDAGKLADSAPMWGAWVSYPAYRKKNKQVNTMAERIQGCFQYSMNGKPPANESRELKALLSYMYWMSSGAPTGASLPGRGYPKVAAPDKEPDVDRGKLVYEQHCAVCHGPDGQGQTVGGEQVFPPLWGENSYNWGAGMHRINTAAAFIQGNMPLGQPGKLNTQQAWDVAAYLNSFERPQDPRWQGSVQATDKQFHNHQCLYGEQLHGDVLGGRETAAAR